MLNSMLLLSAAWLVTFFNHVRVDALVTPRPLSQVARAFQGSSSTRCASSVVSKNDELLPGIAALDQGNDELYAQLEKLRDQPYFRYYSVDILASCEYIPQELFECYTETCEIYPEDENTVPEAIRIADMDEHDFELDGWARWDMPSEDYYDTQTFPEGYTGYDGSEIWSFIHERICFVGYEYDDDHWKADFNKAVSGLHSMISAQVIRGIRAKADDGEEFTDDEIWRNPEEEFSRRMSTTGETPLAMENLYFLQMLLLTAVSKAKAQLLDDCESGKIAPGAVDDLKAVLTSPLLKNDSVGVASTKLHDHAVNTAGSLWEARLRCQDLLRIMNCVQCNKCRLHGKIGVLGLTTAMQILVGRNGEGGDPNKVHRVELAALMTTLHKCATAIKFCKEMN